MEITDEILVHHAETSLVGTVPNFPDSVRKRRDSNQIPIPNLKSPNLYSLRQVRDAHEEAVTFACGTAAFVDGPDDEGLAG